MPYSTGRLGGNIRNDIGYRINDIGVANCNVGFCKITS